MSSFAVQEIEGAFKKDMCVKQSFLFYPRTWVRTVGYGENVFYCVEQTKDGGTKEVIGFNKLKMVDLLY